MQAMPINVVKSDASTLGSYLRLIRDMLSKVKLESLPLPAHDSAAGATATHRYTTWLDSDDGAADDLANAITAHTTDALGACKRCS